MNPYERYVALSCLFHLAFFLSMAVGNFFHPTPIKFEPTIMVDLVALPTQVKNTEQPPPDTTLPPKPNVPDVAPPPEPDHDHEMVLEKKKEAETRERADAALKRMRDEVKKEHAADEKKQKASLDKRRKDLAAFEQKYRQAIAGNQKNEGTSLTGTMKATLNAYVGAVTERIRSNWALPAFLQDQSLTSWIVIHIDGRGNVVAMEFTRVSGNSLFDNYAEGAIRRSSPLPPPPAEMASGLRKSGIEVKFPL